MKASQYYRLPPADRPPLDRPGRSVPPRGRRPRLDQVADWHGRAKARLATCRTCHHATHTSGPSCALIEAAVADGRIPKGCGGCDGHPVRRAFMACLLGTRKHPNPELCPWSE